MADDGRLEIQLSFRIGLDHSLDKSLLIQVSLNSSDKAAISS